MIIWIYSFEFCRGLANWKIHRSTALSFFIAKDIIIFTFSLDAPESQGHKEASGSAEDNGVFTCMR